MNAGVDIATGEGGPRAPATHQQVDALLSEVAALKRKLANALMEIDRLSRALSRQSAKRR